jgi:hypothetical protein
MSEPVAWKHITLDLGKSAIVDRFELLLLTNINFQSFDVVANVLIVYSYYF